VSFEGRRALVTGGAGGIGLATGRILRDGGASLALLDREVDALRVAADPLGALAVVADVREEAQVRDAVDLATNELGGQIDLLVNAAGIYRIAPMLDMDVSEWDEVLGINLRGSWLIAREVAQGLIAAGVPGSIVNISSTAGLVADGEEPAAHYSASKAGVIALTRQMAVEWGRHGIRANAVCPGVIDTPMLRLMDHPDVGRRYLDDFVPLRRLGMPEEVGALIAFLASDEASYITGVAVPIDGGATSI